MVALGDARVHSLHRKANVGVLDRLAADDLVRDVHGIVARDGEANARKRLGIRGEQRTDAHELALIIHERPTGVAGVDGRVHLDEVGVDGLTAGGVQQRVARKRAHDA